VSLKRTSSREWHASWSHSRQYGSRHWLSATLGKIDTRPGQKVEEDLYSESHIGPCTDTNTGNYIRHSDFYTDYRSALASKLNRIDPKHLKLELIGFGIARALQQ